MTELSGHAVTFRSSPTVFARTSMSGSTSTRILSGRPAIATWSAAMLFGLYRIRTSLVARADQVVFGFPAPNASGPLRAAGSALAFSKLFDKGLDHLGGRETLD